MFGAGGGGQVGANVVLTANTSQYNQAMQQSAQQTRGLASAYDDLKQKVNSGFGHVESASFKIAATDIASITAATAAAARFQDQMRGLAAQNQVLSQAYGNGTQRMKEYTAAVNNLGASFGTSVGAAAQLVQTISGFERNGSTQGLTQLARTFQQMSMTTGENASALAQSVLTLGQTMGTTLSTAKAYSDQLTTMADTSNTTAESLANFASQIGPLGRQLNMTQTQVTGFAAAFSKAGQDGYRAANVFSQMTSDIAQAVQTNSPRLQQYANLLGITAQAFKTMSGSSQVASIFDAIGRQGGNALQTLNQLGYDGTTTTRVISAVTQQSGGVQNMIRQAGTAYGNGASGAGQQTFTDKLAQFAQDMNQAASALGQRFLPALQGVMTLVDALARAFTAFMQGPGGTLVTVIASVVAPLALLTGGLLALRKTILLMTAITGLKQTSGVTGLIAGFQGGGRLGSGNEVGIGKEMAQSSAFLNGQRPMVTAFYNRGVDIGNAARSRYNKARGLGGDIAAVGEEEGAGAASRLGAAGRWSTAAFAQYIYNPQWDQARFKNPYDRQGFFANPFGGKIQQGMANLKSKFVPGEAVEGNEGSGMLQKFGQQVAVATQGMQNFVSGMAENVAGFKASKIAQEAFVAADGNLKKAQDAVATEYAAEADLIAKVNAQLANLAIASEEAAKNETLSTAAAKEGVAVGALSSQSIGTSLKSMFGATAGGVAGGVGGFASMMKSGIGSGLGVLSDLAGGPMGLLLMASIFGAPMLSSLKNSIFGGGNGSAPPTEQGTGSFTVPGVVNPNASSTATFNLKRPSAANIMQAQAQTDYTYPFVGNIQNASQAAAMFGPIWNQMSSAQQQQVAEDLLRNKSVGPGGYQQFLQQVPKFKSYGANNSDQIVASMSGGASDLYSLMTQYAAGNYTPGSGGGAGLRALAQSFFGGGYGSLTSTKYSGMGPLNGLNLGFAHLGRSSPVLNQGGTDFLTKLYGSAPTAAQQQELLNIVTGASWTGQNMGKGSAADQFKFILSGLSKGSLENVMTNYNIPTGGTQQQELTRALNAFASKATPLTSALQGFGLTHQQQLDMNTAEQAGDTGRFARLLYGKATPMQMASLYNKGYFPGTSAAFTQYVAGQQGLQAPYMTSAMSVLGSNYGQFPGSSAGMLTSNKYSDVSMLNAAQNEVNNNPFDPTAEANLEQAQTNLQSGLTSMLQSIKSYQMSLDQLNFSTQQFNESMAWAAQQEALSVSRSKTQENIQVGREEHDFNLQRSRSQYDFDLQRSRSEYDFDLQRSRAQQDFAHQTQQMIKQAAESMMNIYQQNPVQGLTSAQYLLYNNANQVQQLNQQESQLSQLRSMGLSTNAIQQLGLTSASNNQELNSLFQQLTQNPALIDQLNNAVQQRLTAAGALATDASSQTYQEQEYQFNLSLSRSATDYATQMKRSQEDFETATTRSETDFTTSMSRQSQDFARQMAYQAQDFAIQTEHSTTQFHQSMAEQIKMMNEAVTPLGNISKMLASAGKSAGPMGALARALEIAAGQVPAVANLLGMETKLTQIQTSKKQAQIALAQMGMGLTLIGASPSEVTALTNLLKNAAGLSTGGVFKASSGMVLGGGSVPGTDNLHFYGPSGGLSLGGGESIMVPEFTRAMGGSPGIAALNAAARGQGYGAMLKNLNTRSMPVMQHVDARSYSTSHSTTYTGDIVVQADDPKAMEKSLAQRRRLNALVGS